MFLYSFGIVRFKLDNFVCDIRQMFKFDKSGKKILISLVFTLMFKKSMEDKTMYHASENIKKNSVVCFFNGTVFPIHTTQDFINAKGSIVNADRDYQKNDTVTHPGEIDLIPSEVSNIKKLIQALNKATGADKKNISCLISKKLSAIKTINENAIQKEKGC